MIVTLKRPRLKSMEVKLVGVNMMIKLKTLRSQSTNSLRTPQTKRALSENSWSNNRLPTENYLTKRGKSLLKSTTWTKPLANRSLSPASATRTSTDPFRQNQPWFSKNITLITTRALCSAGKPGTRVGNQGEEKTSHCPLTPWDLWRWVWRVSEKKKSQK